MQMARYFFFADTVGSLSMLPRKKGGVVDPQLKVSYFTCNRRGHCG
jgi:hypothetical protein